MPHFVLAFLRSSLDLWTNDEIFIDLETQTVSNQLPFSDARCNAVSPNNVVWFTFAPFWINNSTIFSLPTFKSWSRQQGFNIIRLENLILPFLTASSNGVRPNIDSEFICAPWSIKNSAPFSSPKQENATKSSLSQRKCL